MAPMNNLCTRRIYDSWGPWGPCLYKLFMGPMDNQHLGGIACYSLGPLVKFAWALCNQYSRKDKC